MQTPEDPTSDRSDASPSSSPQTPPTGRPPVSMPSISPPPPPPGFAPIFAAPAPRGRPIFARIFTGLLAAVFLISIGLNLYFGVALAVLTRDLDETTYQPGDRAHRIAILPIEGSIDEHMESFVRRALARLRDRPPLALILRVDSPGGGVGAADRISRQLRQFRDDTQIPIVASYASMATSGGYYVSVLADQIIAEPTCITGSIGVISPSFTIEGLLNKIGVTPQIVIATDSPQKDSGSMFRTWRDEDRQTILHIVDRMYEQFIQVVADGRKDLTADQVRTLATGAPLTAEQAQQQGLIDQIGYLDEAIDHAAALAGIPAHVQPHVTVIRPGKDLGWFGLPGARRSTGLDQQSLRRLLTELTDAQFEYRWPAH